MAKMHRDVEFWVVDEVDTSTFRAFDKAAGYAVLRAMQYGCASIDTLVYSKAGAYWLGGDDGVVQYLEDPDASVFERLEIHVNNVGRIR